MKVGELIEKLMEFPRDAELGHLCPDGFNDSVREVTLDEGGEVTMSGYAAWAREERKRLVLP